MQLLYYFTTTYNRFNLFSKYNKISLPLNTHKTYPHKQPASQRHSPHDHTNSYLYKQVLSNYKKYFLTKLNKQNHKTKTNKKKSVQIRSISVPITQYKKNSCIRGKKKQLSIIKKPYFPFFNLSNQVNPHHIKTLFPYKKNINR